MHFRTRSIFFLAAIFAIGCMAYFGHADDMLSNLTHIYWDAHGGSAQAQNKLALMYLNGDGLSSDAQNKLKQYGDISDMNSPEAVRWLLGAPDTVAQLKADCASPFGGGKEPSKDNSPRIQKSRKY